MVSCRCTSRITRDLRSRSSCEILRTRMASSIFCRNIGWIAEKMKNNQNRSPIDMELSFWQEISYSPLGIKAEHAFVRVVDSVALFGSDQQRAKRESRYEPSDMGPPRDVSAGSW